MFCMHCGKELWENARFCQACGTPVASAQPIPPIPASKSLPAVPTEETLFEEERVLVACIRGAVNRERLSWKSVGIVLMVLAILLFIIAGCMSAFSQEGWLIHPDYVWGGAFVSLFVSIVNLRMARKTAALCTMVYTDVRPIIDRYSGSAPVVFSAVFNVIAMFFVVETASKIRSQTAVLERIVKRQQTPCI